MSQVKTDRTTRRDVLRIMARASAAMTLPASTVFAFATDHPDADILRTAAEINHHLDIYEPMRAAVNEVATRWDETVGDQLMEAEGFKAWGKARRSADFEADNEKAWDYYHRHVEPLESALVRIPAKTFDGLAAKAAVVRRFTADHLWDANDKDADWDVLAIRRIADEVIAIVGGGNV